VVHARERRADQGLLPAGRHAELPRPPVRRHRWAQLTEVERDSTVQQTVQTDPRSLSFEQINTDTSGRWRLEKTYVVDPSRSTVLVDVRFRSLTGRPSAAGRRLVPAELRRHRQAGAHEPPARRGRRPDHPGLATRGHRRSDLLARQAPRTSSSASTTRTDTPRRTRRRSAGRTRAAIPRRRSRPRSPDSSFLELVRLGIVPANDPNILNTIAVVDKRLAARTSTGTFWHRYTDDGYGEMSDGSPWAINQSPGSQTTIGRGWPIFAGERGEYELAAGAQRGSTAACHGSERQRLRSAARAGVGSESAIRSAGVPIGHADALRHAARVDPRAADQARVVDLRRRPGRAAIRRGLSLRPALHAVVRGRSRGRRAERSDALEVAR
jgi:Glucodextranase, domain N